MGARRAATSCARARASRSGRPVEIRYDFSKADVVVSLDADPFTFGPGSLAYARAFARRRREAATGPGAPPRFYAIETTPTSSSTLADHRISLKPSELHAAAAALFAAVAGKGADSRFPWAAACAADLKAHAGRGLVIPGEHAPAEVHALAHLLNDALSNLGATAILTDPVEAEPVDQLASLTALVSDMKAGRVDTLLVLGGNPAFDAPQDLGFVEALQKVAFRARLGLYDDETSQYCPWHVNEAHELEALGRRARLRRHRHDSPAARRAALRREVRARGARRGARAAGREGARPPPGALAEAASGRLRRVLPQVPPRRLRRRTARCRPGLSSRLRTFRLPPPAPTPEAAGLEVVFRPDPGIFDGRFANNGWLQEVPKPLTKLTWDNAAHLSPATAKRLGVKNEDLVVHHRGGRDPRRRPSGSSPASPTTS